jgi:hypothetical protein
LTDSAGKMLAVKALAAGEEGEAAPQAVSLFPGKSAADFLLFASPTEKIEHLRLELPGAAFGAAEPVRLLIPRSAIEFQTP